jgi:tetratricopeptide (TPR) repeat protein
MPIARILFALLLVAGGAARADEWADQRLRDGNAAYKDGRFAEAVACYEEIRAKGISSPVLDYNLGNARYRLGDLGRAMASYRRALREAPRDNDLRANIAFVRERTLDRALVPSRFPLLEVAPGLARLMTWREWLILAEIIYALALVLLGLFLLRPGLRPRLRTPLQSGLVLLVVILVLFSSALHDQALARTACIVQGEVPVRSGPGTRFTEEFVLHQGTVARLRREADGWALLELSRELQGWVPIESVEEI